MSALTVALAVTLGGCLWVLIDAARVEHRRGVAAVRRATSPDAVRAHDAAVVAERRWLTEAS